MVENKKLIELLERIAPKSTCESFDNCGLLLGRFEAQSSTILLCVDVTSEVAREAVSLGAQMIVSHHPKIFLPLSALTDQSGEGKTLLFLAENKIACYCMHTNLDKAQNGINSFLCKQLGLKSYAPLEEENGLVWVGDFEGSLTQLRERTEKLLGQKINVVARDMSKKLNRVALSCGAGGGSQTTLENARKVADVFLTAEIKHHIALSALENEFCMLEYSHYLSERVFLEELKRQIEEEARQADYKVKVVVSAVETDPLTKS